MLIVLIPAYFTYFLSCLKAGAGESISMDPIIDENDDEFNDRLRAEREDAVHFNGMSSYIALFKQRSFKNLQTYALDQIP